MEKVDRILAFKFAIEPFHPPFVDIGNYCILFPYTCRVFSFTAFFLISFLGFSMLNVYVILHANGPCMLLRESSSQICNKELPKYGSSACSCNLLGTTFSLQAARPVPPTLHISTVPPDGVCRHRCPPASER